MFPNGFFWRDSSRLIRLSVFDPSKENEEEKCSETDRSTSTGHRRRVIRSRLLLLDEPAPQFFFFFLLFPIWPCLLRTHRHLSCFFSFLCVCPSGSCFYFLFFFFWLWLWLTFFSPAHFFFFFSMNLMIFVFEFNRKKLAPFFINWKWLRRRERLITERRIKLFRLQVPFVVSSTPRYQPTGRASIIINADVLDWESATIITLETPHWWGRREDWADSRVSTITGTANNNNNNRRFGLVAAEEIAAMQRNSSEGSPVQDFNTSINDPVTTNSAFCWINNKNLTRSAWCTRRRPRRPPTWPMERTSNGPRRRNNNRILDERYVAI